jgi:hypothetical protein
MWAVPTEELQEPSADPFCSWPYLTSQEQENPSDDDSSDRLLSLLSSLFALFSILTPCDLLSELVPLNEAMDFELASSFSTTYETVTLELKGFWLPLKI